MKFMAISKCFFLRCGEAVCPDESAAPSFESAAAPSAESNKIQIGNWTDLVIFAGPIFCDPGPIKKQWLQSRARL